MSLSATSLPATRIHHLLQQQAEQRPQAPLLFEADGQVLAYGAAWQRTQAAAAWLAAQGVRPGDRVLVVGENCAAMVLALFACSVLQAWPVCVNARLSQREIQAITDHAEPALTLYTCAVSSAAIEHAAATATQPAPAELWGADVRLARPVHQPAPETGPAVAAVATLIYTSGTTGAPKGVLVPHQGLVHFARISATSRHLVPEDIGYAALPLSHIFGIATVLMATVHAGASLVLRARFEPSDVLATLTSPGLSILQGVPTMFTRLLAALPAGSTVAAPRLRYLYTGGAALDPSLKQAVERTFGLPLHHGYGITEYAGSMFITDIKAPRSDCGAGQAVEGVELRLDRPDGPAPTAGTRGKLLVRGPGVMLGYYRNPEQTAQALLPGGWLDTGDIGYLDAEGILFIAGRTKDLVIRSGFNVYPVEVEAVINAYPGVRLSAVVGHPQPDGNEEVVAFIEPEAGAEIDTTALLQHLRGQLAPYKRPARIVPIALLPTTVSGKILKQPLRDQLR